MEAEAENSQTVESGLEAEAKMEAINFEILVLRFNISTYEASVRFASYNYYHHFSADTVLQTLRNCLWEMRK